jgi:PPOX class probable F420-dependent enzyme
MENDSELPNGVGGGGESVGKWDEAVITPNLGKYMLLTTYRKSGAAVSTPVWEVPLIGGRIGMWTGAGTGKWQRIRNNPAVTVQACNARGRPKPGGAVHTGTAMILKTGDNSAEIRAQIQTKYGRFQRALVKLVSRLQGRLKPGESFGDTIIDITLDPR